MTTTTIAGTIARQITASRLPPGAVTHLTVIELVTGSSVMHDTINLHELFGTPGDAVHITIQIDHSAHVRPKPGRPHVSDDFKLHVLEVWESGGIPAAKAETGLAERTLRRYIADAKKLRGD